MSYCKAGARKQEAWECGGSVRLRRRATSTASGVDDEFINATVPVLLATNLIYVWSLVTYIILHMYCMIAVHGVAIH